MIACLHLNSYSTYNGIGFLFLFGMQVLVHFIVTYRKVWDFGALRFTNQLLFVVTSCTCSYVNVPTF